MTTMYPAKINSPVTQLSAAITISATTVPVVDADVLPTAPNLATIGTGEDAETILYGAKSDDNLTSVTREFQGTKKAWPSGTSVYRAPTAYDHDSFKSNIEMILPIGATAYVIASNASTAVKAYGTFLRGLGFLVWVCDGTADDVELKAALAASPAGDVLAVAGDYYIASLVTIDAADFDHRQSLRFADGARIHSAADVDLFKITKNGFLSGGMYFAKTGYTHKVITYDWSGGYVEHVDIAGDEGAGTGTAISLPGSDSNSITYNRGDDIKIAGFEYQIYSACGTQPTFVNVFTRLRLAYGVNPIYEVKGTESIHGNTYDFTYQAWNDAAKDVAPVMTIAGLRNEISGQVYDFAGAGYIVELTSDSSLNELELFGVPVDKVSDAGTNNTILNLNESNLKVRAVQSQTRNFQGAYVYSEADVALVHNTVTAIPFEKELVDTNTFHSNTVNPTRLTIPTGTYWSGFYLVTGNVRFADSATGVREMWIIKGGSVYLAYVTSVVNVAGTYTALNISQVVYLAEGNYIELFVRQTSGNNLNSAYAYTYVPNFTIVYLGCTPIPVP